jgi:hypothetical protein
MTFNMMGAISQENFVMGAIAAAGSVTVMIPMDTVKTRLVIQVSDSSEKMGRKEGRDGWMVVRKWGGGGYWR